jgi:hypothetical protein
VTASPCLRFKAELSSDEAVGLCSVAELPAIFFDAIDLEVPSEGDEVELATAILLEPSVNKCPETVTADPPIERVWPCNTTAPERPGTGTAVYAVPSIVTTDSAWPCEEDPVVGSTTEIPFEPLVMTWP